MKSRIIAANSSGFSSCRKCPASFTVGWSRFFAPSAVFWTNFSPPRVIESLSENAVKNGMSHFLYSSHAFILLIASGSSGKIGTNAGKIRAPALYFWAGKGALYPLSTSFDNVLKVPFCIIVPIGRIGLFWENSLHRKNAFIIISA